MARGNHRPKANLFPQTSSPRVQAFALALSLFYLLGTQAHQSPEIALSQLLILGLLEDFCRGLAVGECPGEGGLY